MFKSLKSYFLCAILLLTIVPIIILVVLNYTVFSKEVAQSAEQMNQTFAENLSDSISNYIEQSYKVTETLSKDPDIITMDGPTQQKRLLQVMEDNKHFDLLYIQDMKGMQTARSSGELGFRGDRWYYEKMMEVRKPFISPSYYSVNGNVPVVSVYFPIERGGKMVGFLGADIQLTALQKIVDSYAKKQDDTYAYLIDNEGKVVAHPEKRYVEEIFNYLNSTRTVLSKDADGQVKVDSAGNQITEDKEIIVPKKLYNITKNALAGKNGVASYENYEGEEVMSGYAPVTLSNADHWAIITVQDKKSTLAAVNRLTVTNIIVVIILLLITLAFTYYLMKKIIRPVIQVAHRMKDINEGEGDLTKRIETKGSYEVAVLVTNMNGFLDNVQHIVKETKQTSQEVSSHALYLKEQTTSINQASQTATETMFKTSENSAYIQEQVNVTSNVVQNVTNDLQNIATSVQHITEITEKTETISEHVGTSFAQIDQQMTAIATNVSDLSGVMEVLHEESAEISNVVEVIRSIADQTNLLALNASIETARAGEYGKGFAVVANEVRKLSVQVTESIDQISEKMERMQHSMQNALNYMAHNQREVHAGVQLIANGSETFREVGIMSQQSHHEVQAISEWIQRMVAESTAGLHAMQHVVQRIDQFNEAIQHVSAISEETLSSTGEISDASRTLQQTSEQLTQVIGQFKSE